MVIFWSTTSTANYNAAGVADNIYLGATQRTYLLILRRFYTFLKPAMQIFTPTVISGTIRTYGLSTSSQLWGYIHAYTNHATATTGAQISLTIPYNGRIVWFSPSTGATTYQEVNAGLQTITIPSFTTDHAFFTEAYH